MGEFAGNLNGADLHRYRLWDDVEVFYLPRFVSDAEATEFAADIECECTWQVLEMRLFGRRVAMPRRVAWQGDAGVAYRYSGQRHTAAGWTPTLQMLRRRLERLLDMPFNFVLANHYRDGNDSMGWHADDEPELGGEPVIASLSFGAVRRFCLRSRSDRQRRAEVPLASGSLLVMAGRTQAEWQHCIPKARGVAEPRINLTFRHVRSRTKRAG